MFDLVQHRKPKKLEAFIMIIIVFLMLGYPMINTGICGTILGIIIIG